MFVIQISLVRLDCTYTTSPEEVPTVFQHGIHIDRLALLDVNEATVLRVIILQSSSDENGICEYTTTPFRCVVDSTYHTIQCVA